MCLNWFKALCLPVPLVIGMMRGLDWCSREKENKHLNDVENTIKDFFLLY